MSWRRQVSLQNIRNILTYLSPVPSFFWRSPGELVGKHFIDISGNSVKVGFVHSSCESEVRWDV
ncbi:unnamed protein product, partial [Ixodes persulcatus]